MAKERWPETDVLPLSHADQPQRAVRFSHFFRLLDNSFNSLQVKKLVYVIFEFDWLNDWLTCFMCICHMGTNKLNYWFTYWLIYLLVTLLWSCSTPGLVSTGMGNPPVAYIHCVPKNAHIFIFYNNSGQMLTDFNDFWHIASGRNLTLVDCKFAHLTWENVTQYLAKNKVR